MSARKAALILLLLCASALGARAGLLFGNNGGAGWAFDGFKFSPMRFAIHGKTKEMGMMCLCRDPAYEFAESLGQKIDEQGVRF